MFSCSNQEGINDLNSNCGDNHYFPDLPNPGFLDGYYDLLIESFTLEELSSCDCNDLVSIDQFRNSNLQSFWPTAMPMPSSCDVLQELCNYYSSTDDTLLMQSAVVVVDSALINGIVSQQERDVLTAFFYDYFVIKDVDFDYYWCQLEIADKPSLANSELAGLPGALTLTLFQGSFEYQLNNPSYFNNGELEKRWIWIALRGGLVYDGLKKYGSAMRTFARGIAEGRDTSHEAIDQFLD